MPDPRRTVLLLHGLGRRGSSMAPIARAIRPHLPARCLDYPTLDGAGLAEHGAWLARAIADTDAEVVDLVTHSMGGLVVRHALAARGWVHTPPTIGRVVMIAPPNAGSDVARRVVDLLGPRAPAALADLALQEPAPPWPSGRARLTVIAGAPGTGTGYNPLLDGPNDGTVTLAETELPGMEAHVVLPGLHSFLPAQPNVRRAVLQALDLPPRRYASGREVAADLARPGPPSAIATRPRRPVIQKRRRLNGDRR